MSPSINGRKKQKQKKREAHWEGGNSGTAATRGQMCQERSPESLKQENAFSNGRWHWNGQWRNIVSAAGCRGQFLFNEAGMGKINRRGKRVGVKQEWAPGCSRWGGATGDENERWRMGQQELGVKKHGDGISGRM
ncbi:unnamed protein product [Calypogeia fissa]